MARRGRGRAGLAQMCRDMHNLERRVAELTNALVYQRIILRDASDEETTRKCRSSKRTRRTIRVHAF